MKYTLTLFISCLLLLSQATHAQTLYIETFAGDNHQGFSGDGSVATAAQLYGPINCAVDRSGNVYFVDFFNSRVRRVDAAGIITTVAGNGSGGYGGDSSLATNAPLNPIAVAVDKIGNLYIADAALTIRKVNMSTGIIYTIAGKAGDSSASDTSGHALNIRFGGPRGIAVDTLGNIFIADAPNNVIRKINTLGIVTTVAGNDTAGCSGDHALAIHAELDSPIAVAVDYRGNLFISDFKNNVIRKVDTGGIITRYAGSYTPLTVCTPLFGYAGDNGPDSMAELNGPAGIAVDTFGNLYIPDAYNNRIRKVTKSTNIISLVAGDGSFGYDGDTYTALNAAFATPYGLAVDQQGSIYVADANNELVRKIYNPLLSVKNIFANSQISMYPNPSHGEVTINGLTKTDNISVSDLLGRQINSWSVSADGIQTFDISSLVAGVYIMQVRDADGNKKAVIRLVKE